MLISQLPDRGVPETFTRGALRLPIRTTLHVTSATAAIRNPPNHKDPFLLLRSALSVPLLSSAPLPTNTLRRRLFNGAPHRLRGRLNALDPLHYRHTLAPPRPRLLLRAGGRTHQAWSHRQSSNNQQILQRQALTASMRLPTANTHILPSLSPPRLHQHAGASRGRVLRRGMYARLQRDGAAVVAGGTDVGRRVCLLAI